MVGLLLAVLAVVVVDDVACVVSKSDGTIEVRRMLGADVGLHVTH